MIGQGNRSDSPAARLLERAWGRGWARRPTLDADAIAKGAGNGPWRRRLDILCRSLDEEAALNPVGLTSAHVQLRMLVRARIRLGDILNRHPEILSRPIAPPVLIVGQMRSGTTRIHRLLACDPRFAVNRLFEQFDPVPYRWLLDPRPATTFATNTALGILNRQLETIHPTSTYSAEEDFGLHSFSIWGAQFEGQWRVPCFARHVEEADAEDVYQEFASILRVNGWKRGLDPAKPWLLKAPQFTQELDAVLGQFPRARMIVLRRDQEAIVGSGASLVWNHMRLQSDSVTPEEIGREWLRKTQLRTERMDAALHRFSHVPKVELDYSEVSRDWRQAVARIYDMLGWNIEPATQKRMERFIARSTAHRGHRYSLTDFGLSDVKVSAGLR